MRGVIYARYSEGPRQTDQSIEGQVADCRSFAAQKGIDIVGIYADRHISGKSIDGRDEFVRMMHDAERRHFDCIIVWKVDRFGRSREDIAVNKIKLRRAGVQLMYARESIPEGPEGILLESLMEGLAEYYSADLRQKVLRGQRESAKKGLYPTGQLPVGYKKDTQKRVVIDEEKAAAVRELFRMHIAGASHKEMQDMLFRHGVKSKAGAPPAKSVIYRILRNERYLGTVKIQDVELSIPQIIDEETFKKARLYYKTSSGNAAGGAKVDYLLSLKCHCGYCGKLLSGETGTGKMGVKYHYYKCRQKGCELKPLRQLELEDLVISHTITDVLTDSMIGILTDRIMAIQETETGGETAALKNALKENRKKQKIVARNLEYAPSRTLAQRLSELEAEEEQIQTEIERESLKHVVVPREMVRGWLESFRSGDTDDALFRRRLVETFIADIDVKNDEIIIQYNAKGPDPMSSDTVLRVRLSDLRPNTPAVLGPHIFLKILTQRSA
ncbi:MAG: recombinase family protein [Lachnospiraceae bacterium]|nr:recombinase family protein [Lachnospiraceae bacterium]